jgi:hypothetical protein
MKITQTFRPGYLVVNLKFINSEVDGRHLPRTPQNISRIQSQSRDSLLADDTLDR